MSSLLTPLILQPNTMWNHQHTFVQLFSKKLMENRLWRWRIRAVQDLRVRPAASVINPLCPTCEITLHKQDGGRTKSTAF